MINPFRNQRSDLEKFRKRVLEFAVAQYPGTSIRAAEDEEVIIVNDVRIGLQNLKSKFHQSDRSHEAFEALVGEHISLALEDQVEVLDFETVRSQLKPQIMPPEFAVRAPIISFPLGKSLAIGVVMDGDKGYSYIRTEDANRWKQSDERLLSVAIANLGDAVRGKTKMEFFEEKETKWLGIETKDGFDAARILLPGFRKFLADKLSSPFHFAIPNRDFLICWNAGAAADFVNFATSKIKNDFETQPYALSPNVFKVALDDAIVELDERLA